MDDVALICNRYRTLKVKVFNECNGSDKLQHSPNKACDQSLSSIKYNLQAYQLQNSVVKGPQRSRVS